MPLVTKRKFHSNLIDQPQMHPVTDKRIVGLRHQENPRGMKENAVQNASSIEASAKQN
jgi:hypothetical protein